MFKSLGQVLSCKIFVDIICDEIEPQDYKENEHEIREQLICMYLFSNGEKI